MSAINGQDGNTMCFACGMNNPIGLKLQFTEENGQYLATFIGRPEHQSYDGVMHGGIVSTLLDEIMAGYIHAQGCNAVTAKLEVRFKKPTPIGRPLQLAGSIVSRRGNMIELQGSIVLVDDGTVTAQGKAIVAVLED